MLAAVHKKSSVIIFYRDLAPSDQDNASNDDRGSRTFVARASRVFNVAQVDGFTVPELQTSVDRIDPCEAAEALIACTHVKISIGGDRAFYNRMSDQITMPDRTRFIGTKSSSPTEAWYSTLLHELTHWSGAEHRMARTFGERFGDDAYAMEEMVAELGAAFLCGDLGITVEPRPDHADYIGHWLRILKADRKAIFAAASAANKASEFLMTFSQTQQREAA
ncbi:ArdC family protein [Aquidulcibacter sp.]|jgi:antirestriction protein ArdC|uniref:ArdC family protein n=1 Tax=Aquidulcibacter sp. TaxID=2052990 RepID=UPI0037C08C96